MLEEVLVVLIRAIWSWSKNDDFSVKSAYTGHLESANPPQWRWEFIWKLKISTRILHFLWTLLHDKLFTNLQRERTGIVIPVAWSPPTEGWIKLNIDGSQDNKSGTLTAGGVIRNSSSQWVKGFVMKKGCGSVIEAELWGLFEDLKLAWNCGYRKIIVETDSLTTIQLLFLVSNSNHPLFSLLQNCKRMIANEWHCDIVHVFREGNL
ncbi:hypothetical protein Ddye_013222 [Dipteronia dyeriana]|uniref:RNase H type-1 domain-containing protein n=1 Tax=Dipteronia dyeriana TaxID=168575 RepID=A0AAE0CJF1_9ROSI|nr:hypothetical protein Ddye_013222 [Dipteronia dyeriana]